MINLAFIMLESMIVCALDVSKYPSKSTVVDAGINKPFGPKLESLINVASTKPYNPDEPAPNDRVTLSAFASAVPFPARDKVAADIVSVSGIADVSKRKNPRSTI